MPLPALGQTEFVSNIDSAQVPNGSSDSTATGFATLTLNAEQTELAYSVQLFGLDLDPVAENRIDPNDVVCDPHPPSCSGCHWTAYS